MSKIDSIQQSLQNSLKEFIQNNEHYGKLLQDIFNDVTRSSSELLEVFPVCHHSPASASFMIKRLQEKQPKVIFMELCEDMRPLIEELHECKLPVALQAFALNVDGLPKDQSPLNVIAPITEFSAEFQAIAWALSHDVELIFVDRSSDHIYQWYEDEEPPQDHIQGDTHSEEYHTHGNAVGIQMGDIRPTFREFEEHLLENANVQHYSEWWNQYIEDALIGENYTTYRQLFYFIGSLFRRFRQTDTHDYKVNCQREQYMWQRIKEYVKKNKSNPSDCLYICGAFHAVSDVKEFGIESTVMYDISPQSNTEWLYGLIPSSYYAIEEQFGLPQGTISLAETTWKKNLKEEKITSFSLSKKNNRKIKPQVTQANQSKDLLSFLGKEKEYRNYDSDQLVQWCADVVRLARNNGYLATSADSIAIYQTSLLLANMRNREFPTPYDFKDAAITCLQKDSIPKKRTIEDVVSILLGANKTGTVGYESLPPLAQNIYDRLKPLNINLNSKTVQRALLDLKSNPHLQEVSDLLWKLRFLLDNYIFRPIMGEKKLGQKSIQESWDIALGKYQGAVIQLGYEGATIEYVIEKRLREKMHSESATTITVLQAVEESILYLKNNRLTHEIGEQSVSLITKEESTQQASATFKQIRHLLHYFRSSDTELPLWIKDFITEGYSHYCTVLPTVFSDDNVQPLQVSSMIGFIFTLESLALSMGCERQQFLIALEQSNPEQPEKKALLWSAQYMLSLKSIEDIRVYFDELLDNPLRLSSLPHYIGGFILTVDFTTKISNFIIELMSKAFERLPDKDLFVWLPQLITTLQKENSSLMVKLLKEASRIFPKSLNQLSNWTPYWYASHGETKKIESKKDLSAEELLIQSLLKKYPETTDTLCTLSGYTTVPSNEINDNNHNLENLQPIKTLLQKYSETVTVLEDLL